MSIVRYEPWALLNRLHRELDQTFDTVARDATWSPAVDIHEEEQRFVLRADLPGVKPADIEITAEKGVLALRGSRNFEQKQDDGHYSRIERVTGKFVRSFTLPENVQTDAIKASFKDGVLELTIPKQAKPEPRKIEVQAA
ncbi:MAG TPA: Hsp20/alpha crystallin family protein [Steroidobacteraceae bacterium]|jgi:HSP20 family protein|nr:Hsp20/alpha crystallin family protein [Steroidobacteraceae bacterium]